MINFKIHFKKFDWVLFLSALGLVLLGLVSLYSISLSRENFLNFKKQVLFLIVGIGFLFLVSFLDWRALKDDNFFLLGAYFFLILLLMGIVFFGKAIKGAKIWYRLGVFSFDPIEFLKIVLIAILAKYFSLRHKEIYQIKHIFISGLYVFLPSVLIFLQPNMGAIIILIFLWVNILIVSGVRFRYLSLLIVLGLIVLILMGNAILKDYQKERIKSFIFPSADPLGTGWSQKQAKIALGSGRFWGKGFARGTQIKYGFLPLPQTDFIFSAYAEEFGFLGVLLFFLLLTLLFKRCFNVVFSSRDNFSRLFIVGFLSLVFIETFVHLGVNLSLLPVIGTSLPFLSYGGSNLLSKFILLGIVESIKIKS